MMRTVRNEGARFALERAITTRLQRLSGRLRRLLHRPAEPSQIEHYSLMKSDNVRASSVYQADEGLTGINSEILDYIYAGAVREVRCSPIARWLGSPAPDSRRVYRALLWIYYNQVKAIDTGGFLSTYEEPGIGGVRDQEIVDGRAISLDFLQSVEEAYSIRRAWELSGYSGTPRLIVELGAGYGRLAYVCRKMMPDCTYVLLDLPESLVCAHSWLASVLPDEVISYAQARSFPRYSRDILSNSRVWTLGTHAIEQLEEADVFVSLYNFAVMSREAVENYFTHIDRMAKVLYSKHESAVVNEVSEASQPSYPVRPHWRRLFYRTTSLYDEWVETAYRVAR